MILNNDILCSINKYTFKCVLQKLLVFNALLAHMLHQIQLLLDVMRPTVNEFQVP